MTDGDGLRGERATAPTYGGLVAQRALDHVLVHLAVQVDERLAHAAVDDGNAARVRAGDCRVRRRQFRFQGTNSNGIIHLLREHIEMRSGQSYHLKVY